jgi:hypothetical protein
MVRGAAWLIVCLLAVSASCEALAAPSAWGGDNSEWGADCECPGACSCWEQCCCGDNRPVVYPTMLGDQLGFGQFGFGGFGGGFGQFGAQFGQFGGQFGQFSQFGGQFGQFGAPISVFRGAYKISENESPVPQDRVFLGYNYYNNVRKVSDVHRETPGFEKTFLDGIASIGLRAPAIQVVEDNGSGGYGDFGDLTIPIKFALSMNPETGSVLSAGMAVTAPTGKNPTGIILQNGAIRPVHSTLLQPFVGYYWKQGDFFVQGFHSVMTPTDSRDVTAFFNDVGIGYWIESWTGPVTAVVPTIEIHVNTPLNHSDPGDFPRYRNSVNLTSGATVILNDRLTISSGIVVPITAPKLFDLEALVNANLFF